MSFLDDILKFTLVKNFIKACMQQTTFVDYEKGKFVFKHLGALVLHETACPLEVRKMVNETVQFTDIGELFYEKLVLESGAHGAQTDSKPVPSKRTR